MTSEDELKLLRRVFAKQVAHAARAITRAGCADDSRIEEALASLRREDFLPPAPWRIARVPGGYQETPDDDAAYLYQDVPVALLPEKRLNNGQPSFLAALIALCRLREGERAIHIGAGAGYYTAILSCLAGPSGRVVGVELEPELAATARNNLASFSNVAVVEGDGATIPMEPADVILVNAGAARPADIWLDALKPGGRMIAPLTVSLAGDGDGALTKGAIFSIERPSDAHAEHFSARAISQTFIYPCVGQSDEASEKALAAAFEKGGARKVTRLYRTHDLPEERCWLRGAGWSLAYE